MKIKVYNMEGKVVSEREMAPKLFDVKVNEGLVHLAAEAQDANSRVAAGHSKTRGEVRGGGKKPWKQKGTGRARHGSSRSPIWVGGGITFGPQSDRNYSKKINRKSKKVALAMALSDKVKNDALLGLDVFSINDGKTKLMAGMLKNLPVGRKTLLVLAKSDKLAIRASRNLQQIWTVTAGDLNLIDVLKADTVVAAVGALDLLEASYAKSSPVPKPARTKPADKKVVTKN
jgi:large subunit ribosomal protein L4